MDGHYLDKKKKGSGLNIITDVLFAKGRTRSVGEDKCQEGQ
jgi:hypothetical protein